MRKNIFFIILLLSICGSLRAQTMYEFNYYFDFDGIREEYKALMYTNGDGTGFMRVKYFNNQLKTWFLIDMDMKESYGRDKNKNIDYNKIVFEGIDPYVIIGDTNLVYAPDLFWFKVDPQTGYMDPWAVVSVEDGKKYEGVYTKAELIEMEDLTKDFVLQFFPKDDPFYKSLFEPVIRTGGSFSQPAKLHLVTVANTEDDKIGPTCAIDKKSTNKIFSSIATVLGISFKPTEIFGNDFSKANVLKALNGINSGPNDIIVFYYSGHGFSKGNNDPYLFPYLDLRLNNLTQKLADEQMNIEEIYKMIKAKQGRVKLVLSDCCNWGDQMASVISPNVASSRSSSLGLNIESCQQLFMSPEPVSYLITAAQKGELSAGTLVQGGFFTSQFKSSLEKYMGIGNKDQFSWSDVVRLAQEQTKKIASGVQCPQPENETIFKDCKQTPVYKRN
ncbi:MAG: caspase family protein [Ferruginibacter sp.]